MIINIMMKPTACTYLRFSTRIEYSKWEKTLTWCYHQMKLVAIFFERERVSSVNFFNNIRLKIKLNKYNIWKKFNEHKEQLSLKNFEVFIIKKIKRKKIYF